MPNSTPPNDDSQQQELIVAYLDGELSPSESAQVEQRLASDEQFREQLQGFDRAWAALDQLPGTTVDDKFSQTTMAMVVASAQQQVEAQTVAMPIQRRKRSLATVLLATTAALLGFLLFRLVWDNPNDALLADLPAIQFVDAYSQFHDVEFLRQLRPVAERGQWEATLGDDELQQRLEQFAEVAPPAQRKAWIRKLSSEEKVMLRAKFDRFRSMPEEKKQQIRNLHQEIVSDTDATELQKTMFLYRLALNSLSPSQQFEMRKKPSNERIRESNKLVQRQRKYSVLKLTDEQLLALSAKVHQHVREIRPQTLGLPQKDLSPREQRAAWKKIPDRRKLQMLLRQSSANTTPPPVLRAVYKAVLDSLPKEVKEKFLTLKRPEQIKQIGQWIRQARGLEANTGQRKKITEQILEDFFAEELDAQQREQLLAMPRDAMQRELRRLYRGGQPDRPWKNRAHGEGPGRHRNHRPSAGGKDLRRHSDRVPRHNPRDR